MKKTKLLIVNNNMKIGGVQKSLYNLLWSAAGEYDITLLLFAPIGAYADQLPPNVRVQETKSLFRLLGRSQAECGGLDGLLRGALVVLARFFGRDLALKLALASQKCVEGHYDCAIAFLQNGNPKNFYGGVQEFVIHRVNAKQKIACMHCDYSRCGADHPANHALLAQFDRIALCSEGCKEVFETCVPALRDRTALLRNCHRIQQIRELADCDPVCYEPGAIHLLMVGRLAHEKGVERGILAAIHAAEQGYRVVLHIVGDGPMLPSLQELVYRNHAEGFVVFHGEQENPYRFMKNADLFLLTSYHEAAPMVLEEAAMLSLPVLTVRTTSSQEMVVDRSGGWVCENDQDALNAALVHILKSTQLTAVRQNLCGRSFDNSAALAQFAKLLEDSYED